MKRTLKRKTKKVSAVSQMRIEDFWQACACTCFQEPSQEEKELLEAQKPIFVIQKHNSRRLHYDFRLEVEGALVSWAVRKGVPKRVRIKRLAVHTTDHPIAYANFEGIIPVGEYGAGIVRIEDKGTYTNITRHRDGTRMSMYEALERGILFICLQGASYKGCYVLVKTNFRESKQNWIIMKIRTKKRVKKGARRYAKRD